MNEGQLDVVLPVHNAYEWVTRCIDSLLTPPDGLRLALHIIDDGSEQETAQYLGSVASRSSQVSLVRFDEPGGFTRAVNRGLEESRSEAMVILNSDTIVPPRAFRKLYDALYSLPGVGLVGPLSNAAGYQSVPRFRPTAREIWAGQSPVNTVDSLQHLEAINTRLEQVAPRVPVRVPLLHGFCLGIRSEVLQEVGFFDEQLFPRGYGAEEDYCFRAIDAGWSAVVCPSAYVWHAKSASSSSQARRRFTAEAKTVLDEKYTLERRKQTRGSLERTATALSQTLAGVW